MIDNDRQYRVAKEKAAKLEQILLNFPDPSARLHIDPRLQQLERESVEDLLSRLNRQLSEYEALVNETRSVIFVRSLEDLPSALNKAREMAGRSVKEVAQSVGVSEAELREHERNQFSSASYALIVELARVLDVSLQASIVLGVPVCEQWMANLKKDLRRPFGQRVEATRHD